MQLIYITFSCYGIYYTKDTLYKACFFFNNTWYFTSNVKPLKTAFLYKDVFYNEEMTEKLMPQEIIL